MIVNPESRIQLSRLVLLASVGFGLSCIGHPRPVADSDLIGCSPAIETTVRVKKAFSIESVLSAYTYIVPEGEYVPSQIDRRGIFYASPRGILERSRSSEELLAGGIYIPISEGFFAYPALFIDPDEGPRSKLALPDEVVRGDGQIVFLTRNGIEVVR
jgi:hypothetical protein